MSNKRNMINLLAIIIAAIILISIAVVVYEQPTEKDKSEDEPDGIVFDDKISPFLSQSITVEILRIRNRGLFDKMLTYSTSWRHPPTYYWIAEVDGEVGDSAHLEAAGGVTGEGTFTEWDNILKECRVNFKVDDEQETSDITIKIMEEQKTGLLKKKTTSVEKMNISLIYNYRTGHWTGDDHLKDSDGYGHHLSEEYEIWFNIYQSDYDHDGIPFWTEVNIYGSDPTIDDTNSDPDNDGIPSPWEWRWGYDPNTWDNHEALDPDVDGIENIEEYMVRKYFSDPFSPDMYIETDGMKKGRILDWHHIFFKESQQMVIEIYARHGINVYIDDGWPDGPVNGGGELLDFVPTIDEVVGGHMYRWYRHNFADERKGIFRYVVVGNNAGVITPSTYNNYDHIVIDTSVYKTYVKRTAITPRFQRVVLAKGVFHELGHSCGLSPWTFYGIDNMPGGNFRWPDTLTDEEYKQYNELYKSIMNYNYIFSVLKDRNFFDYSDGSRDPVYDFDDWGHLYLPSFQTDDEAVEEPQDETFEDLEKLNKHPEPVYKYWVFDENLTDKYMNDLIGFDIVKNADCDFRIYINQEEKDNNEISFRVYIKPKVDPVVTLWSLVSEGNINQKEDNLEFYSFDDTCQEVLSII